MVYPSKELKVAIQAAKAAGIIIRKHHQKICSITTKADNSPVTEADYACDAAIIKLIRKHFPSHNILTEESGMSSSPAKGSIPSPYTWVVDPLDGTTAFVYGADTSGTIISLAHNQIPVLGAVCVPLLNQLFYAQNGKGAYLNGKRLSVRKDGLPKGIISMNYGSTTQPKAFEFMLNHCHQFRFRIGKGPESIVDVARGFYDGALCIGVHPWDIAGCAAIVQEAGGKVTNFDGKPWTIDDKNAILAAPHIYPKLLAAVERIK